MFVKITSLATLPGYILLVGFSTGEYKKFDVSPLIEKYPPFQALRTTRDLFENAKIDIGGYGVVWNDDLDLSADGLYEKGVPCEPINSIEDYRKRFLEELIKARKKYGVSQKQLEILTGSAQPSIARTEQGITDPSLSTILKMLEPLGLTISITPIPIHA